MVAGTHALLSSEDNQRDFETESRLICFEKGLFTTLEKKIRIVAEGRKEAEHLELETAQVGFSLILCMDQRRTFKSYYFGGSNSQTHIL